MKTINMNDVMSNRNEIRKVTRKRLKRVGILNKHIIEPSYNLLNKLKDGKVHKVNNFTGWMENLWKVSSENTHYFYLVATEYNFMIKYTVPEILELNNDLVVRKEHSYRVTAFHDDINSQLVMLLSKDDSRSKGYLFALPDTVVGEHRFANIGELVHLVGNNDIIKDKLNSIIYKIIELSMRETSARNYEIKQEPYTNTNNFVVSFINESREDKNNGPKQNSKTCGESSSKDGGKNETRN